MMTKRPIAFAFALGAGVSLPTAASANTGANEAESIRTLDMMLMATSLRCRKGAHDFRAEYATFSRYNSHHLLSANAQMRQSLSATYGQKGGERALDRLSVKMANRYGNGHPWMDCRELKIAAGELARAHTTQSLSATAARLLKPPRLDYDLP